MLNPRQVEAFRTVIVTGGISNAARALNITQPAVSRLIQDLQYALGLTLFERRGRASFRPTRRCRSIARSSASSSASSGSRTRRSNLREGRAGSLRVAALPAFNVGFLPRLVGLYLEQRPDLEIALYGSISSQVVDWVTSGFCELGFAQLPLDFPGIDVERLPPSEQVAIVPVGHRLASKAVLAPEDFADEPFVSLEQSTQLRYRVDALFSAHGVARITRIETPLSMIACGLVAAGAGVSVVDPFTAAEYRGKGIEIRLLRPSVAFDMAILWGAGRFRSGIALDFAERVRSAVIAAIDAAAAGEPN
jgi:DNA-binding transcriptional LysR family regulator